jgi:signal transduction histidine kinase
LAWEEALRLERIARNLIDVSRIAQGKVFLRPSDISLPDLINKSIASLHLLSQKKNLSIIPDLPINLPPIFADPDLLSSILINLLDNAIKFSPPNQKIILKASILPSGHPLVSNKNLPQANFYLLISITDFGPGIDPESKEIIFQMFEKGKSAPETKGLGIGLSIVKEFVQAHKGVIWVESKKNVGSTFTFIIPFLSPPNQIENWKLNHGRKS